MTYMTPSTTIGVVSTLVPVHLIDPLGAQPVDVVGRDLIQAAVVMAPVVAAVGQPVARLRGGVEQPFRSDRQAGRRRGLPPRPLRDGERQRRRPAGRFSDSSRTPSTPCAFLIISGCDGMVRRIGLRAKASGENVKSPIREPSLVHRRPALSLDGRQLHRPADAERAGALHQDRIPVDQHRLCPADHLVPRGVRVRADGLGALFSTGSARGRA